MPPSVRRARDIERLVDRIVEELFTSGAGEHADRLVLMQRIAPNQERDLGGWGKHVVRSRLVDALLQAPELAR